MPLSIQEGAAILADIRRSVATPVLGQDDAIDDLIAAFIARGHVLIEGVPGTAKTLLARSLSAALGLRFGRIQFTPDLMPADVTGVSLYREHSRSFEFQAGPVFTEILLADEINRAPAKTQAALLEAMGERQVTVDGTSRPLEAGFTVFATQNPVEHEGTFPLPEAQLDRFLLKVVVGYPDEPAELSMLELHEQGFDPESPSRGPLLPSSLKPGQALEIRALVDRVKVAPEIRGYIAAITRGSRDDPSISLGASPRATVAVMRAARASAVMEGRDYVTPDAVKARALAALRHRITLAPEVEVEGRVADDVLTALLARIPTPA